MSQKVIKSDKGFSLVEILVAIFLIALVIGIFVNTSFNASDDLEETGNNIERSIRFGVDEAALRNVIVRVRFYFDDSPQKFSVEYGPNDSFVIPLNQIAPDSGSIIEREARKKEADKFNKEFNRVAEFSDGPKEFKETVRLIAVGSSLTNTLVLEGQASVYFYPSGEKDGGIVVYGTLKEVIGITFEPFLMGFNYTKRFIDKSVPIDEIEDIQDKYAKEIFEEWLKK